MDEHSVEGSLDGGERGPLHHLLAVASVMLIIFLQHGHVGTQRDCEVVPTLTAQVGQGVVLARRIFSLERWPGGRRQQAQIGAIVGIGLGNVHIIRDVVDHLAGLVVGLVDAKRWIDIVEGGGRRRQVGHANGFGCRRL